MVKTVLFYGANYNKQGTLRILTDMAFFLGQRKVEVERRTKGQTKREKLFCKW